MVIKSLFRARETFIYPFFFNILVLLKVTYFRPCLVLSFRTHHIQVKLNLVPSRNPNLFQIKFIEYFLVLVFIFDEDEDQFSQWRKLYQKKDRNENSFSSFI